MKNRISQLYNEKHWIVIAFFLMVFDFLAVVCSYTLALYLRFDFIFSRIEPQLWAAHIRFIFLYALLCIIVFCAFRMYRSIWRFASYQELLRGFLSNGICFLLLLLITLPVRRMPISYYAFGIVCQTVLTIGVRFSYRFVLLIRSRSERKEMKNRVMLIGAGAAGLVILREIMNSGENSEDKICCIVDDNPNKWGRMVEGIPVVGGRDCILKEVSERKINKIIFAIPSAKAEQKRDILQLCNETGCVLKQVPSIGKMVEDHVSLNSLQDISMEDLLGRPPVKADMSEVFAFIHEKVILVTGGGGSIGSELCRQVAAHGPKQLIILDVYENNAYAIQLELREKYPDLNLVTLIGSVRDSRRVNQIFADYRPDVVYHAAAHKHVPLMEDSPCEAIKNNVIGTYKVAMAAARYGTRRFVLVSTDKAVNPTNMMGASKRLCEMVVQTMNKMAVAGRLGEMPSLYTHEGPDDPDGSALPEEWKEKKAKTEFVAVRFGNVLGSNGSVVPIFKKQIEKGGPVTVTHPDIIRYFMTVPEAVSLILLAGTYAKGGEIFVLDMGSPVKIDSLARNLICLVGLKPDVDIKIEYTGLRPGEKLYEEKLMAEEGLQKTANDLIYIGNPIAFDTEDFLRQLQELETVAYANDDANIRSFVAKAVKTYQPADRSDRNRKNSVYLSLLEKKE